MLFSSSHSPRIRSWRRRCAVVLLAAAAGLSMLWFLPPGRAIERPVRLEQGADGRLHAESDERALSPPAFAAKAGLLKAQNQRSAVSSQSNSDPCWFAGRTLLIQNRSDHPLMHQVGAELLDKLRSREGDALRLEQVDYFPHGQAIPGGNLAPDLILTLSLESCTEQGPLGRELTADVSYSLGTAWGASNYHVQGPDSPPFLDYSGQASIRHHSTLLGAESSAAKFSLQGASIAESILEALSMELRELHKKYSAPPALPAQVVGEYRGPPAFSFLERNAAVAQISTHGFGLHNETFWTLEAPADAATALTAMHGELARDGWTGAAPKADGGSPRLAMRRGDERIEIFRERQGLLTGSDELRAAPHPLIVRYQDRMSAAEREAWFQRLLDDPAPDVQRLLDLRRLATPSQQGRVIELLKSDPPRTCTAWLALAEHYQRGQQPEPAEAALRKAFAFSLLEGNDRYDSRLNSLAKDLGVDRKSLRQVDAALWVDCGLLRVDAEHPVREIEFAPGETATAYLETAEGWSVYGAHIEPLGEPDYYRVSAFQHNQSGLRSWSTVDRMNLRQDHGCLWYNAADRIRVEGDQIDAGRLRLRVLREPKPIAPTNESAGTARPSIAN